MISDTDNANNTNHTNNNLDITNRVNSGKKENKKNSNSNNNNNNKINKDLEQNNIKLNNFHKKNIESINRNVNNENINFIFLKTFNGNFSVKNYENVNEVLEPLKNIIKIERKQKIKSISPNLKFLNVFEEKGSRGSKIKTIDLTDLSKLKLMDNNNNKLGHSVENLKKQTNNNNNNNNICNSDRGQEKEITNEPKLNSHRINFNTIKEKEISFKKILNTLNNQESFKNSEIENKKKARKHNILLKNKSVSNNNNNFITQNASELKSIISVNNDSNFDLINEISNLIESCGKSIKDFLEINNQMSKGSQENFHKLFASAEEIEYKIISNYDKIMKHLQEKNINDYHFLTNEFFLKNICGSVFLALAQEKKITCNLKFFCIYAYNFFYNFI